MSGHSNQQLPIKNYSRVSTLDYIRRNRQVTKSELSSVTGLTFMAIKKIIEELTELHLIREDSVESGGLGRRAVTYVINEDYGYTVGLHINIFRTGAAVMDLHGKILARETMGMEQSNTSQAMFIEKIVSLVKSVIRKSGVKQEKILGLGIGAPGPVNSNSGIILTPPNAAWLRYLPLKQIMEDKLGLPTLLQKDTNAIAMGEYWRGAGVGYQDMIYIDADMGIGSGMILQGKIHQGANYIAGEFGHMTLDLDGPQCNCGNFGCLEAMGSGIAILRDMSAHLENEPEHSLYRKRKNLVMDDILEAANNHDPLAISIFNNSACYMGAAIGSLINIVDPEVIILGGMLMLGYQPYFEIVRDTLSHKRIQGVRDSVIVPTRLADSAGIIGAGEIVADHYFTAVVKDVLDKK